MSSENRASVARLGTQVLTRTLEAASRSIFPYEVIEGVDSFQEMKSRLGSEGFFLFISHFCERDAIQGVQIFEKYLAPYSTQTVMPIARHMYNSQMGVALQSLNINALPIPDHNWSKSKSSARSLPESERHDFFDKIRAEQNLYIQTAANALNKGGLVGIAAQAKREPHLAPPTAFPVQAILDSKLVRIDNVAIVSMGIGFAEPTDYSDPKVRGLNPFRKFVVKVSKIYRLAEVLDSIKNSGKKIDYWVYEQLLPLVPPEYVK